MRRALAAGLLLATMAGCSAHRAPGPGPAPAASPPPTLPVVSSVDPPVRVSVAAGCPRLTRLVAGIDPVGPPVRDALVPTGQPTAGLVCTYVGADPRGEAVRLAKATPLNAPQARALAASLREMPLAGQPHPVIACAAMWIPSGWIDVLSYPGRPDVAVWLTGCPTRADNGWVRADEGA